MKTVAIVFLTVFCCNVALTMRLDQKQYSAHAELIFHIANVNKDGKLDDTAKQGLINLVAEVVGNQDFSSAVDWIRGAIFPQFSQGKCMDPGWLANGMDEQVYNDVRYYPVFRLIVFGVIDKVLPNPVKKVTKAKIEKFFNDLPTTNSWTPEAKEKITTEISNFFSLSTHDHGLMWGDFVKLDADTFKGWIPSTK